MTPGEEANGTARSDEGNSITFGSFPPSENDHSEDSDQYRLEVEKLLAVIARGRSAESRHLQQLTEQSSEISDLRARLQHYTTCHPQLLNQHQELVAQYHSLRDDHAWLSHEHLTVFSGSQQQQARLEALEQQTQHARQQLAAQDAHAARLQSQLDTAEMANVELRIERAAVQNLQGQLLHLKQSEAEQQQKVHCLEAERASLCAACERHQQEALVAEEHSQDVQQQLQASEKHRSELLASLKELRAAFHSQSNGKVMGRPCMLPLQPDFASGI